MHSATAEQYLRAVWLLGEQHRLPATIGRIAARLGRAPATVSQAIRELECDGLVEHARYAPATLTRPGRALAIRAVRRDRITRTFLHRTVGCPWPQLAEESARIAPVLTEQLTERMHAASGAPDEDPYGNPIPDAAGRTPAPAGLSLPDLPSGTMLRLVRIDDVDRALLELLHAHGLTPGARLCVPSARRSSTHLEIRSQHGTVHLSPAEAVRLHAEPAASEDQAETVATQTASVAV